MTTPERARHAQAAQLLRLRELRRTQAQAQAQQAQQAQAQALAAVQAAQVKAEKHKGERQALLASVANSPNLARWADLAHARREVLEDLLERAEYALIDDEEDLDRRDHELDQAGAELRRAWARTDAAEQALARARSKLLAATERRAEREDSPNTASPNGIQPTPASIGATR